MKKRFLIIIVMALIFPFVVSAQSASSYIPDIKLLVSTDDGETWNENLRNLRRDQPFYLMVESSIRIPGFWRRNFGAKEILCTIAFPEGDLITLQLHESDIAVSSFPMEQTVDSKGERSLNISTSPRPTSILFPFVPVLPTPAGIAVGVSVAVAQVVYDKMKESSYNKKLNEFLTGNHNNQFSCLSYLIPTTPAADSAVAQGVRPRVVKMIFKVDPLKAGSQPIKIFFENKVNDMYMKTYTLVIN